MFILACIGCNIFQGLQSQLDVLWWDTGTRYHSECQDGTFPLFSQHPRSAWDTLHPKLRDRSGWWQALFHVQSGTILSHWIKNLGIFTLRLVLLFFQTCNFSLSLCLDNVFAQPPLPSHVLENLAVVFVPDCNTVDAVFVKDVFSLISLYETINQSCDISNMYVLCFDYFDTFLFSCISVMLVNSIVKSISCQCTNWSNIFRLI